MTREHKPRDVFFEAGTPIKKVKIYGSGCYEIVRECLLKGKPNPFDNCTRGKIKKMTNKSISRLIVTMQATDVKFSSMLTLTYPKLFPHNGEIVKADVGFITQWIRKTYDLDYLWFFEFQQRGAPHLHIMLSNDEISPRMRSQIALKWTERTVTSKWFEHRLIDCANPSEEASKVTWKMVAVHSHPKSWELIKSQDGAIHYVTKYAAKAYQKDVPKQFQNVGRFWGCSNTVRPKIKFEIDVTDDEVREFLAKNGHAAADWEILPKYLFNVDKKQRINGHI